MIDAAGVANVVFQEARLFDESMKFDSLDLTADEQFARSFANRRPNVLWVRAKLRSVRPLRLGVGGIARLSSSVAGSHVPQQ